MDRQSLYGQFEKRKENNIWLAIRNEKYSFEIDIQTESIELKYWFLISISIRFWWTSYKMKYAHNCSIHSIRNSIPLYFTFDKYI